MNYIIRNTIRRMGDFIKETHRFLEKPIHRIKECSGLEKELKLQIRRLFKEKNSESSFPGAQPISLEKKNLEAIVTTIIWPVLN